jgi:ubiquinone/menaquinone biosynthesis C-methylase UbiE
MGVPDPLDEEVLAYYARGREDERLIQNAEGLLERVRTEELLERFLPPPPNIILDVGGGTGHYAVWLAERGYEVHLSDPVPLHVEQARRRSSAAARPVASISLGGARSLGIADCYASGVLLLGPLYHLTTREDRLAALREAGRVLRPGGVVVCAVISRFASALDGLKKHLFDDPLYESIVRGDLADGQHRDGLPDGTRGQQSYFTTAYLHRPDEIADEMRVAGFEHEATLAVEGPAWMIQDLDAQWQNPIRRSAILGVVRAIEAEASLLGVSSHLLAIGRRSRWPIQP